MVGLAFAAVSASLTATPAGAPPRPARARPHRLLDPRRSRSSRSPAPPSAGPRLLLTPGAWEAGAKVVLYGVAGAFFVLPLVFGPEREGWVRERLSGPVPTWLGDISYGIFAIHMLVLNLVFALLDLEVFTGRFLTVAALTLAITIVLATSRSTCSSARSCGPRTSGSSPGWSPLTSSPSPSSPRRSHRDGTAGAPRRPRSTAADGAAASLLAAPDSRVVPGRDAWCRSPVLVLGARDRRRRTGFRAWALQQTWFWLDDLSLINIAERQPDARRPVDALHRSPDARRARGSPGSSPGPARSTTGSRPPRS